MKIGLDLDGCVADYASFLLKDVNKLYGSNLKYCDFKTYDLDHLDWVNRLDVKNIINKHSFNGVFGELEPIDGSLESIKRLSKNNSIHIITHRFNGARRDTLCWLDKYNINFDSLSFTPNKGKLCNILGIDFMIDDSPSMLSNCYIHKVPTICFDQPWNREFNPRWLIRKNGWSEVEEYLNG